MKIQFEGGSLEAAVRLSDQRDDSRHKIVNSTGSRQFGRGVDDGPPDWDGMLEAILANPPRLTPEELKFLNTMRANRRDGMLLDQEERSRIKQIGRRKVAAEPPGKGKAASAKRGSSELVVRPASNTAVADTRQQHLDAVGAAFATIANAEISRVEAYITAGEQLVAAKAAGAHGTWGAWLDKHFPQSEKTAERAISCWHHRDGLREESTRVSNFSLRKAMDFIAQQRKPDTAPSTSRKPGPVSKRGLQQMVKYLEEKLELKQGALEDATNRLAELTTEPVPDQPAALPLYVPPAPSIELMPATDATTTAPSLKELSDFEHAADAILTALNGAAKVKVPQIHTQRATELLDDIDEALVAFRDFRDKIAGIAVGGVIS